MFRRKDNDPSSPESRPEPSYARSSSEAKPQPELPRRQADVPPGPSAPQPAPERPQAAAPAPAETAVRTDHDGQGKRLIVGQGISLSGEITACDRLVVEGSVQVTLNETRAIEITETGRFTDGKAEVEEAEISGHYEGELTVRNRLFIRSTGQVKGTVRYGEIEIERGGQLTGTVSMLDETGATVTPPRHDGGAGGKAEETRSAETKTAEAKPAPAKSAEAKSAAAADAGG